MKTPYAKSLFALDRYFKRRRCTKATIRRIRRVAFRFLDFVKKPANKVTRQDVRSYLASRAAQGVARRTLAYELGFIRTLFRAISEQTGNSPALKVKIIVPARPPGVALPERVVKSLLEAASRDTRGTRRRPKGLALRDRALLELLYGVGLRASEAGDARVSDVNLRDGTISVRPVKWGLPRTLPLPPSALPHLQRYLDSRGYLVRCYPEEDRFLVSRLGKRLRASDIFLIVVKIAKSAGVKAHPHALRHALASHLVRAGVSLPVVKEVLGHNKLSSTTTYVSVTKDDLRATLALLDVLLNRAVASASS